MTVHARSSVSEHRRSAAPNDADLLSLGRPHGTFVAWAVIVASVIVTLVVAPNELRHTRSDIQIGTTRPRAERAEQPARTVGLPNLALFGAAARLIPEGDRYRVITGPRTGTVDPQILRWVKPYARYVLLPRRLVGIRGNPEWILSYGGNINGLGLRYERIVLVGRGLTVAKVGVAP